MRVIFQEPISIIKQIASYVSNPRSIGIGCDSRNVNSPRFQIHDNQNVHRDQPGQRPNLSCWATQRGQVHLIDLIFYMNLPPLHAPIGKSVFSTPTGVVKISPGLPEAATLGKV